MKFNEKELKTVLTEVFFPSSVEKVNRTFQAIDTILHPYLVELTKINQAHVEPEKRASEHLKLIAQLPDAFVRDDGALQVLIPGMEPKGTQYIDENLVKMTFFATYVGADETLLNMLVDGYSDIFDSTDEEKFAYRKTCSKAMHKFRESLKNDKLLIVN